MRLEGGGGADDEFLDGAPIMADINVTPLVDVFLLLLVIFMVTSSAITSTNIPVQLPSSQQAANSAEDTAGVIVTVDARGQLFVNTVAVERAQLGDALKLALSKSASKTVVLEGDKQAMLGSVVDVMDEGKKAGAEKFAVAAKASE